MSHKTVCLAWWCWSHQPIFYLPRIVREKMTINSFYPFCLPHKFHFLVHSCSLFYFIFSCSLVFTQILCSYTHVSLKPLWDVPFNSLLSCFMHLVPALSPHLMVFLFFFLGGGALSLLCLFLFLFFFFNVNSARFPVFSQQPWETWQCYFYFLLSLLQTRNWTLRMSCKEVGQHGESKHPGEFVPLLSCSTISSRIAVAWGHMWDLETGMFWGALSPCICPFIKQDDVILMTSICSRCKCFCSQTLCRKRNFQFSCSSRKCNDRDIH